MYTVRYVKKPLILAINPVYLRDMALLNSFKSIRHFPKNHTRVNKFIVGNSRFMTTGVKFVDSSTKDAKVDITDAYFLSSINTTLLLKQHEESKKFIYLGKYNSY